MAPTSVSTPYHKQHNSSTNLDIIGVTFSQGIDTNLNIIKCITKSYTTPTTPQQKQKTKPQRGFTGGVATPLVSLGRGLGRDIRKSLPNALFGYFLSRNRK